MGLKIGAVFFLLVGGLLLASPVFSQKHATQKVHVSQKHVSLKDFLPGCRGDRWIAEDKYRHFWASAFVTGWTYTVFRYWNHTSPKEALLLGGGFSISLGIAKELHDKYAHAGCASWKDLTADFLGVLTGALIYTGAIRF